MSKEDLKEGKSDLLTILGEVLGNEDTARYYQTVFSHLASRIDGKSGRLVRGADGTIKCLGISLGKVDGCLSEMTITVGCEETVIRQLGEDKFHLRSELVKPASTDRVPEGAFAVVSKGKTIVLLGVEEMPDRKKRPTILTTYSP